METASSPAEVATSPSVGRGEQVWRDYERQRRLRLTRILLPICVIIQSILVILSTFLVANSPYTSPTREIAFGVDAIEGLCLIAFVVGIVLARRGYSGWAVASVIVPASVTTMLPVLAYDLADQLQPSTLVDGVVNFLTLLATLSTLGLIVLASVLTSSRWLTVGATILINIFTVVIAILGANTFYGQTGASAPFIEFAVLTQWTVGGILAVAAGIQRATLKELDTTKLAYERSKQMDELKDQFITHINHELRGPVMAVQGYLELLQVTAKRATPEQRESYVAPAKRAADNLARLVTTVLSMRSLEQDAGPGELRTVDLRAAITAATEAIDPHDAQAGERELRVSVPPDLAIWGDPVRVQQILTNLLANAVKYSAPGTPVIVAARPISSNTAGGHEGRPVGPSAVEITVRDYGHGIPPEQITLLFERFVRLARDLASNVPGNGLGLYLSRKFAEAMGGRIWAESSGVEGEGSTFHLELPAAPTSPLIAIQERDTAESLTH